MTSGNKPLPGDIKQQTITWWHQATNHYPVISGNQPLPGDIRQQAITWWHQATSHYLVTSGNKPLPKPMFTQSYATICLTALSHYLPKPMLTYNQKEFYGVHIITILQEAFKIRRWACLVTWFCYQMIAKTGNKTGPPSWPDPYQFIKWFWKVHIAPTSPMGQLTQRLLDVDPVHWCIYSTSNHNLCHRSITCQHPK